MSDAISLPAESVLWLQRLARARDAGDGWDAEEPSATHEELLAIGVIEYRPAAFRLSDIGFWVLNRVVAEGDL